MTQITSEIMSTIDVNISEEFAQQIPNSKLPSKADILKAILFEKENRKVSYDDSIKIVSGQVSALWQSSKIPAVIERTIFHRLTAYLKEYLKMCKIPSGRTNRKVKEDLFKV